MFRLAPNQLNKYNNRKSHPLYQTWEEMWNSCYNEEHPSYTTNGGRGLAVWEGFRDFAAFTEYMGARPTGHILGRLNTDNHFIPGNVRWDLEIEENIIIP